MSNSVRGNTLLVVVYYYPVFPQVAGHGQPARLKIVETLLHVRCYTVVRLSKGLKPVSSVLSARHLSLMTAEQRSIAAL
ncbi:MAG: hypothetical protein MUQ10_00370 [Anaerolineae bacterium]|nr:hypothetical protein [Anaerolineae bacterium]